MSDPLQRFIALAEAVANVQKATFYGYSKSLRMIVSDSFDLDLATKFDAHRGGYQKWRKRVDAIPLAKLTPQKIQQWKRTFLAEAAPDPVSQRSAKVSINSFYVRRGACFPAKS